MYAFIPLAIFEIIMKHIYLCSLKFINVRTNAYIIIIRLFDFF